MEIPESGSRPVVPAVRARSEILPGRGGTSPGSSRARRKGAKVQYLCAECGESFSQWFGRCPSCQSWGSLKEFRAPSAPAEGERSRRGGGLLDLVLPSGAEAGVQRLGEVPLETTPRMASGIGEFDRTLGGGLVAGSVVLLGGDPGIGKSTLMLQVAGALTTRGARVLYVSGEESAAQVRLRSERLVGVSPELLLLPATNLEVVAAAVEDAAPEVVVIDSIQTAFLPALGTAPGSLSQVRESALALLQLAKSRGMTVLLVGHVTKEGTLAGPKTLEDMVDTVLYMEGERYQHYRILRSAKNRFGGVHEIGVFEMAGDGLREVPNPSQVFLSEHTAGAVGSVVVASLEGSRALLMEVQSLVNLSHLGFPQRVSTGYDARRLEILLAVLSKRAGLEIPKHDVFVSVAGGLRVEEPGVDLGVLLAVASSRLDRPPHPDMVAMGEIGLGGEVRRVARPDQRLAEAARLGYRRVLLPASNRRDFPSHGDGPRLIGVSTVAEALEEGLQAGSRGRQATGGSES